MLPAQCGAARVFIPGVTDGTPVIFRPANWDGDGMCKEDLALDITAGGQGIKGEQDSDGTIHSCFASVISQYAGKGDQRALRDLVYFVDIRDTYGSVMQRLVPNVSGRALSVLNATGLGGIFCALQTANSYDDSLVVEDMGKILSGMWERGRTRKWAKRQARAKAREAEILPGGRVALAINLPRSVNGVLFREHKISAIVFVSKKNVGVLREGSMTFRTDDPEIRAVVDAVGEGKEWFAHPKGFLYCRGSSKAVVESESRVNPRALAEATNRVLMRHERQRNKHLVCSADFSTRYKQESPAVKNRR